MRADSQPVELLRGLDLPQTDVVAAETFWLAELRRQGRVLLGRHRTHGRHAIFASASPRKRFYGHGKRRFAAPRNIGLVGKDLCLRRMIDVLHEQRIAFAWRENTDGLGRHRPLCQPLHHRAETVGAAEDQVIAPHLCEERRDGRASPQHFLVGEARILRFDDAREMRRKRHVAFFGSATIMSSSTRAPGEDS